MVPKLVTALTASLSGPAQAFRAQAIERPPGKGTHDALACDVAALQSVEVRGADGPRAPEAFRVAAWNIERCKYLAPTIALLARTGAQVLLLSEMDHGMARAGNVHTTAEVGAALHFGHIFATEFVELGLGDAREQAWHAGETNREGLHGNAVLAPFSMATAARIALDEGGRWFEGQGDQRRIGGRCAVAATLETVRGPLLVASLHLESHSDAADRTAQVAVLLDVLNARYGAGPAVIAGDFNTSALPQDADPADASADWFAMPHAREPLFAAFEAAGFDWRAANTPAPTERTRPDGQPAPPFRRIDWFFTRGVRAANPMVWPATDEAGQAISDHELITVDLTMP